jgi:hypothetical protein
LALQILKASGDINPNESDIDIILESMQKDSNIIID